MSLVALHKVGSVSARLITPLWIGGYNASTYSSTLDLIEPVRPYEIKGVLRWMLRILAFSAIYERTGDLEVSRRKAIRFVESILGKASDRSGRSSIYLIRIENPEGGVLPKDLEIRYDGGKDRHLILRNWARKLYEMLWKSIETNEDYMHGCKGIKEGINIYYCIPPTHQTNLGGKIDGIMLPLPFMDVSRDMDIVQSINQHINMKNILCFLQYRLISKLTLEEYQIILLEDIKDKIELKECLLGKNILRYQLEPPRDVCINLLSIGEPRTRLTMLKGNVKEKAEKVFMIPPGVEVTISVYRKNEDIKIGNYILSGDEISVLDDVVVRSLSLALLIRGLGKAVNRGYGSFEIIDLNGNNYNLKTIYDPRDIKKEIDYIKESISSIMSKAYEMSLNGGRRGFPGIGNFIGFIDGYYDIYMSSPFEIDSIPNAISTINYMVLHRFHSNTSSECMSVLGLPRGGRGERLPSLIRFRIVRCDMDRYCTLIFYFLALEGSIIIIDRQRSMMLSYDEINSCVREILDRIVCKSYYFSCCSGWDF
jgi:CRISPR type III-B/RAMP module RAMP protein Cmr1